MNSDKKVQEVRALQAEFDRRTGVEAQAVELIMEGRFTEAMELLDMLSGSDQKERRGLIE